MAATPAGPSKVMVIAEENEEESAVIGSSEAPYLTRLAATYGQATNMQAGYPTECPSLAAYIIITSGDRAGICDDKNPVGASVVTGQYLSPRSRTPACSGGSTPSR